MDLIDAVPEARLEEIRGGLKNAIEAIWHLGIIASNDKLNQFEGRAKTRRISLLRGTPESPVLAQVDIDTLLLEYFPGFLGDLLVHHRKKVVQCFKHYHL